MKSPARRSFLAGSLGVVALGATAAPALAQPSGSASDDAPDLAALAEAQRKALARTPEVLFAGDIKRNKQGAVTSAEVRWPDGTVGTFTADTMSKTLPGVIDAYHITYGKPVTATYTQAAVKRNASGAITHHPQIEVSS
jgi:hypothetical protein